MTKASAVRAPLHRAKALLAAAVLALPVWTAGTLASAPRAAADDPRYVYIVNSSTKMMAEIRGGSTDDGAPAILWPHYGGASQQFKVEYLGSASDPYVEPAKRWFLLRAKHSGKCLKTVGYGNGAAVVQKECGGDASQMWRVRGIARTSAECSNPNQCFAARRLVLENYYDRGRRCLDAANGSYPAPPRQGTGLQAWDCIGKFSAPNAVNQEWELVNIQDWGGPGPVVK